MFAEKVLRKHVAIIHAYSMMSALQRKIVNVLLCEAKNQKNNENNRTSVAMECSMPFSVLADAINFNSNNTQYLKEAIDGLASLKIEWNLLKDKAPTEISFLNLRILHGSPTFYKDGGFNFSFHKLMLDLVGNPQIYGTIDMTVQALFESKYGHALYENSSRFVNLQKSKIIQLDTIRKLLGVQENKYQNMRELTRNVIKPSLEEVNDRADFVVNLQSIRMGKKITGFEISAKPKKSSLPSIRQDIKPQSRAVEEIKQTFGKISEFILDNILRNYTEDYILEKIVYTKEHTKKESSGCYPAAYFISALKGDYKISQQNVSQEEHKKEKNSSLSCIWNEKYDTLKSDFNHWKELVDFAQSRDNPVILENNKKSFLICEEKLKAHIAEKPGNYSESVSV